MTQHEIVTTHPRGADGATWPAERGGRPGMRVVFMLFYQREMRKRRRGNGEENGSATTRSYGHRQHLETAHRPSSIGGGRR